jgi:aspartate-semialdehyde dehydrogenase
VRIAVVGATGALGAELLVALDDARLAVDALVPIATERSLGSEVELGGAAHAVETELAALRGADLVFLCAPAAASLEAARTALRERVPAIDCSGALAANPEVPLAIEPGAAPDAPLVAVPTGAALACARVLAPLAQEEALVRIVATVLESASGAGREGVSALSEETVALLSQRDLPDPPALGHPVAFDVLPWCGEIDAAGTSAREEAFTAQLGRALGVPIAVSVLRVPVFCGDGVSLALELHQALPPEALVERLGKLPDIELGAPAPTTRGAAGSGCVHVGRIRRDPSRPHGLLLWLAVDGVHLTAAHGVRVAEARYARM